MSRDKKPNILWVSYESPDQDGQGGQRRQFHQIRALVSRGHASVTVLVPRSKQSDTSIRELVRTWRPRLMVKGIHLQPMVWLMHRFIGARRWDAIIVAHHTSWALLPKNLQTPTLLDFHNVLSRWYRDAGEYRQSAEEFEAERKGIAAATVVSVCSNNERLHLLEAHPEARQKVFVAPLGVDPAEWQEACFPRDEAIVALFGSWYWGPNATGLEWMIRNVWPAVSEAVAGARLLVAGPGVKDAGAWPTGAHYVGRVADLAGFLSRATVVAVPVFDGVGAPLKYAEALASGGSVISTPDGASAFPAAPAHVSQDADEWSRWIIERLRERRTAPAPAPLREYALGRLTWEKAVEPVVEWLQSVGASKSPRPLRRSPTSRGLATEERKA
ncbi:glycosyltransferase family 4 protein [Microbacterium horticulturae]|uniref:Glycosyltransferase family 4 protein n=1 Tax=Microbacterium horticulturae TaxID=3028316 RepID=A0ABY8C3H3_9MICO|nr:glycosyltransferase family 4 protein [Microbacterium sp. KACC 23027]WEG09183.1 glycosyltransferase family 4 protein [Microbacterium sp. KACC 23027]